MRRFGAGAIVGVCMLALPSLLIAVEGAVVAGTTFPLAPSLLKLPLRLLTIPIARAPPGNDTGGRGTKSTEDLFSPLREKIPPPSM